MIILLHSSKSMRRSKKAADANMTQPQLLEKTVELQQYLKQRTVPELMKIMKISEKLAKQTKQTIDEWSAEPNQQSLAIDSFVGDIYSGLRAGQFKPEERSYANETLRILSGLYGVIRPYDSIMPYRLEMGYKTPGFNTKNLYDFWGDSIGRTLPRSGWIVNASSDEYTKAVLPYVDAERVITPKFLTYSQNKKEPVFVVVHAKIARGAFARWLVTSKATEPEAFKNFGDLGYTFDAKLSSVQEPVFVCREFKGLGLSQRLVKL